MSIQVVVSSTAAGVSVSGATAVAISVGSVSASVPVTVGGGIGPAGFVVNPGTATSAFGTFQLAAGDGITISTSAGQFQIASYGTAAVSSLAPVQSVAGRVGAVQLQASDVTAGTFAIARIPTISYTALANVPTSFGVSAHTHSTSDIASFTAAAAAAAPVQLVAGRTGAISLAVADVAGLAAVASSGSYTSLQNVPTGFAPSAHTHSTSDVVSFTSAAASAAPVQLVAGRTGDIVISTTDIDGLADALASVNVDIIDGGDYVGVVVEPTPSITITAQPANRSASVNAVNEVASTLPSGTWGAVSRAYDKWFVSGHQNTQADYVATSDDGVAWTRKSGLPSGGLWSAVQYANGVYATQSGNTVAYSSNLTNWSASTITFSRGSVFAAGGKFLRATQTGLFFSNDAATWTQAATFSSQSGGMTFGYSDGKWFAFDANAGTRVSTDGAAWSAIGVSLTNLSIENVVTFSGKQYIGMPSVGNLTYASGTWGQASLSGAGGYGCQFATDGSVLVAYSYAGKIFSSTNGTTFVERTLPISLIAGKRGHLLHANGKFVLVMAQEITSGGSFTTNPGTIYFTSPNGVDWTQATRAYPSYGSSFVLWSDGYYASQSGGAFSYLQIGSATAVAAFTVSAFFSGNTITYQWQVSTDAGSTFANVSGATNSTLSLSGLTAADNGKRYRCVLSATGASSVTSNSATLTVT